MRFRFLLDNSSANLGYVSRGKDYFMSVFNFFIVIYFKGIGYFLIIAYITSEM